MTAVDPRKLLDQSRMSSAQVKALLIVSALSALDGYDLLSVTFAAPGILANWQIGKAALGLVLASSLIGVGLGSLFVAPFADLIGRRRMVVVNLILMAAGMLASAFAASITELAAWRVLTGVGIGSMIPIILPLASEYSNDRRRRISMAVMTIGYPLGGTLGGALAAVLLRRFDWPAVFIVGAALALLLVPVVLRWLPEPLAYLLARRNDRTLGKVNALLVRFGHAPVAALADPEPGQGRAPYLAIFSTGQIGATLWMTLINLLFVTSVYFILSWMPQLVADMGYPPSTAALISSACNLAGVVACLSIGAIAHHFSKHVLAAVLITGIGLSIAAFGHAPASIPAITGLAMLVGACLFSGTAALYTVIVDTFDPRMRATGVGFVTGVGRGGAGLAPAIAGALFASGMGRAEVAMLMGAAAVLGGVLILFTRRRSA